jgi:hypothetical protein
VVPALLAHVVPVLVDIPVYAFPNTVKSVHPPQLLLEVVVPDHHDTAAGKTPASNRLADNDVPAISAVQLSAICVPVGPCTTDDAENP